MKKIKVEIKENPYSIYIGSGLMENQPRGLYGKLNPASIVLIIDKNVSELYSDKLDGFFTGSYKVHKYVIPEGEKAKSFQTLNSIYAFMLDHGCGRDTLIAAAGGGVTGDLAGYAAATFMRGVDFIQIPTTLLAMVDSSVGGKTGINFGARKNIIGAFYQPRFVVADIDFLSTLPEREMLCGLGEILKYAFLADESYLSYLLRHLKKLMDKDPAVMEKVIIKSVQIKAAVVSYDEKEGGLRKTLNLGHTFGHAYESALKYRIGHGQAVTAGLACAMLLSRRMGLMHPDVFEKYAGLVKQFDPAINFNKLDNAALYEIMLDDKKNRAGKIKFVLPVNAGETLIDVEASREDVMSVLDEAAQFFR